MEPFPDLGSLSDADLKQLIDELTKQERILHGRIERLRAELQARLEKNDRGKSVQRTRANEPLGVGGQGRSVISSRGRVAASA